MPGDMKVSMSIWAKPSSGGASRIWREITVRDGRGGCPRRAPSGACLRLSALKWACDEDLVDGPNAVGALGMAGRLFMLRGRMMIGCMSS